MLLSLFITSRGLNLISLCNLYEPQLFCRYFEKTYELDATELYKEIKGRKREAIFKIVYYIFLFGFYLFRFVIFLLPFWIPTKQSYSFIKSVIDFEQASRQTYS